MHYLCNLTKPNIVLSVIVPGSTTVFKHDLNESHMSSDVATKVLTELASRSRQKEQARRRCLYSVSLQRKSEKTVLQSY